MTAQQLKLLNFIRAFVAEHEFSPSYEEMATFMGFAAKSAIHRLLKCLERGGHVRMIRNVARSVTPVHRAPAVPDVAMAGTLTNAVVDAHGFDDGEGLMIVCTPKELRQALLAALTR